MSLSPSLGAGGVSRLTVLLEDGERILCRGWRDNGDGEGTTVLAVLAASEHPAPAFVDQLAHEYELKDELDGLKKQLQTQGDKLNDQTRGTLVKQIDQKQKSFDRSVQDAREDAQNQQNEIAQRILQKMLPIVVKYAGENQYGLILDTSNSWPQGPVLWAGTSVDITKAIVDSYNLQSGVAAPANPKPAATRPATTAPATKPATAPATTKPAPK